MKIDDLFDSDLLTEMVEQKMVTIRTHDGYPLSIYNYSDLAQYANLWNDVTMSCRGLVVDQETGEVLARPWKKFFNLGDAKAPHIGFDDLVEVTDKMDGSLGILYVYDGKPSISTRGSFRSTQAGWATKQIRKIAKHLDLSMASKFTFLFEIIYPTNRIVVDYGSFEGLVLLGCVDIETGWAYGPDAAAALLEWSGLTTQVMPFKSINDVLAADDRDNTEGYVIRRGSDMVKWKRPDYVELHRLISNLSEKSVWSGLEARKTVEELVEGLPDEFHGFVRETSLRLLNEFSIRKLGIEASYSNYRRQFDAPWLAAQRKGFAMAIRNDPDKAYYFAMLDRKPIDSMIWQELKPKGEKSE